MKERLSLTLALVLALSPAAPAAAQETKAAPQEPATQSPARTSNVAEEDDTDEVVRITTNLVQVDAVVTDKDGRQVTDLKAEDFVLTENGKRQEITNFSYIALQPPPGALAAAAAPPSGERAPQADKKSSASEPPAPTVKLRPERVTRRVVLVVDDLLMSFTSANYVKKALRKFVDEQVQPGDEVAIFRTRGGVGALQQFTSDKRHLYTAINSVRVSGFRRSSFDGVLPGPDGGFAIETSEEHFTVGTLGSLNLVVRSLRELPGRKAIVLFSDRLPIFNRERTDNQRILSALDRLVDSANRASAVIYTIDTKGLEAANFTAADGGGMFGGGGGFWRGVAPVSPGSNVVSAPSGGFYATTGRLGMMREAIYDSQEGLQYLAQRTGGFLIKNSNDFNGGLRRMLDDQRGYYLIGYRPDASAFDPKTGALRFNKVKIDVKRPGLRVRTRSGFIGVPDDDRRPHTREQQVADAYASLFASTGIDVRLTSLFTDEPQSGASMRSLLHIDLRDLKFTGGENWDEVFGFEGSRTAALDIMAVTFDGDGRVVSRAERRETIEVKAEAFQRLRRHGLHYVLNVPVKKSGAYQLRVVVRDATSHRVGSASQFVEVPDLRKNRLTLSGLILQGAAGLTVDVTAPANAGAPKPAQPADAAPPANAQATEAPADDEAIPLPGPAVRRLRRGTAIEYGYTIYNAQPDPATRLPKLYTQVRLFRDGRQIYAGAPTLFDAKGQSDLKRLVVGGRLQLGQDMPPGDYVLQVIVRDELTKDKRNVAWQWTDFEIVK